MPEVASVEEILPAPKDVHAVLSVATDQPQEVTISWNVEEVPTDAIKPSETTFSVQVRPTIDEATWMSIPSAEDVKERRVSVSVEEIGMEEDKQYEFKVVAKSKTGDTKEAVAPEKILIRESICTDSFAYPADLLIPNTIFSM